MTTKNKLVWRLSTKPTVDEVTKLLEFKIITPEEAKELLLRNENDENIATDQLKEIKEEIKILRELVLSRLNDRQIKIIHKYYDDNWSKWPTPYKWCNTYFTYATNKAADNSINEFFTIS